MTVLAPLLLSAGICLVPPAEAPAGADSLATLWRNGRSYREFLGAARERRDQWLRQDSVATMPDALLARARNAGRWRLLVLTVHACSDSIKIIPYLDRLSAAVPDIELRIADTTGGRWLMEAHRTPDGRAATPTVLLLDDSLAERGCWIERPAELQRWYLETGRRLGDDELRRQKAAWYDRDAGRRILEEIIAMMESAVQRRSCPAS